VRGKATESDEVCESMAFDMFLAVVSLPRAALWAFFICLVDSHTVDFPDELAEEHELRVPEKWLLKPGSLHANAQLLLNAVLFFLPRWTQRTIQPSARPCIPDAARLVCRRLLSYLAGARAYVAEQWGLGENDVRWEEEWGRNIGSFLIDLRRHRCYGEDYFHAAEAEREQDEADYAKWATKQGFGPDDDGPTDDSDDADADRVANLRHLNRQRADEYGDYEYDDSD
jgi:hypothetical protein